MRKIHRRGNKSNRVAIISTLLAFTLCFTVAYSAFSTSLSINTKGNIKEHEWNFDYTGSEQVFSVPMSGYYQLEVWGAQGGFGSYGWDDKGFLNNKLGGYGGYSVGTYFLKRNDNLYLNVGQKGQQYDGGYNGGGTGVYYSPSPEFSGGGGGATDISFASGLLDSFENNVESIIVVAGGGGGGSTCSSLDTNVIIGGGSGGGFIGVSNYSNSATGATQTGTGKLISSTFYWPDDSMMLNIDFSDGVFGKGGNGKNMTSKYCQSMGGGGAGFYGGLSTNRGGSGGSGYIGSTLLTDKHMACYNCEASDEESTKTISVTCSSEIPTKDCAKIGNGYARITYLKNKEVH